MRGRIMAGALGLGCAGLAVLTLVTPAAGERNGPPSECARGCGMPAGNMAADCEDASMNTPPSGSGDVKLTADVVDGATVAPGQDIMLRLTWDPTRWSGKQLDRALDCVRVKGEIDEDLSAEEAPTANDGLYEYRLHVPDDIKPGCDICAQGFVAGDAGGGGGGGGGPQELRSERHCFMSGSPTAPGTRPTAPPASGPSAPPASGPSAPPASGPSAPSAVKAPSPTPKSAAAPAPAGTEAPEEVAGITASRPGITAPQAAPAELPRTGAAAARTGTAGGGLALCLGGLAVIGGAGRRTRRRTAV